MTEHSKQGFYQNLILFLLATTVSSVGFIVRDYYEGLNRQQVFQNELQKDIYDNWLEVDALIEDRLVDVFYVFANDYAISSYQIEDSLTKLHKAYEHDYWKFKSRLQNYGTKEQIEQQENFTIWLEEIISTLDEQYNLALALQEKSQDLLRVENTEGDQYDIVNTALDSKIKSMIENENIIYDKFIKTVLPQKKILTRLISSEFRKTLGLAQVDDTKELYSELSKLLESKDNLNKAIIDYPFLYADYRTEKYKFSKKTGLFLFSDDQFVRQILYERQFSIDKNAFLSQMFKKKFMDLMIQKNPDLQELIKERQAHEDPQQ